MLNEIVEKMRESAAYFPCNVAVYRMGAQLERAFYTEGLAAMCGYTKAEYDALNTDNAFDNVHPQDRRIVEENLRDCIARGVNHNFVYRIRHKTKGFIWVHAVSRLLERNDGEVIFSASLVNVSDEMRTGNLLLESTDRGVVLLEKATREVLFVNPQFLQIAETTEEACLGKPCNEVICRMGAYDAGRCICLKMEASGETQIIPGKYGHFYSMHCKTVMLGEHEALAYFLQDVTDSYLAEKQLEQKNLERKDMLEALNQTNEMIMIADWNTREILYLNKAATALNHGSITGLLGKKCSQIVCHTDERCPYCFIEELQADALSIKELKVGKQYFQAKGKRIRWNGREAFIEYVSNITAERSMTEQVVREREMLIAAVRTIFPLGILSNLTQNTFSIFEYDRFTTHKAAPAGAFDDLIEAGVSTVHEDDRQEFAAKFGRENLLAAYENGTRVVSFIHRQLSDDKQWHWIRTLVVMADQRFDDDLYAITLSENVDAAKNSELALKKALDTARQADQEKTAFLARMSHELRTPLNAISGYTHLLEDECRNNPVAFKNIAPQISAIQNAETYLLSLINRVLDMQQMETGRIELVNEVYDASDYLSRIVQMIRLEADKKRICFTVERRTTRNEYYYGDGIHTEQILLMILSNAIKFTPEGGMVTLSAETAKESGTKRLLRFTIADTGIGMSEKFVQQRLFHLFNQENETSTTPYGGVGISMAFAKELAQKMGGDITCESLKGKGTVFTFTVEVTAVTDEEAGVRQNATLAQHQDFTGTRILLCEDNPINQRVMKKLLENKSCVVDVAANGKIGLEMFCASKLNQYRLILMDIRMPEMNGYDATVNIRALNRPDAKSIPIYAVSANSYETDIRQSFESGMDGHIAKPVEPTELYAVLECCVNDAQLPKAKLLVVDDVEVNRVVITETLRHRYNVLEADDGEEAYHLLEQNPDVQAVITDIQMPKMSGVELIRAMKADERFKRMIVIANTQFGDCPEEDELLALGTDDFIYKPTSPKVVELRIRNALRKVSRSK